MMKMSDQGTKLAHYYESCRLKAYPDPATGGAPWTIGWGHTGPDVYPGLVWSQEQADEAYARDISKFERGVESAVKVDVTQRQFDAMVCLAYNIGLGNFGSSTLLRLVNAGDMAGAADQFRRWDKAAGQSMKGLRRRRAAEAALFRGLDADEAIAIGQATL